MIEFITLFLGGLVTGHQTVEVMVGDPVAIVEIWLDGELESRLEAAPWRVELNLGQELSPHRLEAVAFDAWKRELGRAQQWLNMSPQLAQSSVVIEGADQGRGAIARVSWESLAHGRDPTLIEAYFDGKRLIVEDPRVIRLPDFDPMQTHHVRVRLEFDEQLYSEAEAVFGGIFGSEVSSEISAVPISFEKGKKPRSSAAISNWFSVRGVPQRIHAIEQGPAEVIVVRDEAAKPYLQKLEGKKRDAAPGIYLGRDVRLSFINPCPITQPREGFHQLVFPRTQRHDSKDGTLLELLARVETSNCSPSEQQLANALGIAGLSASEEGLRRMVVLLLSDVPQDRSDLIPSQVIHYLRQMRVPLVVWSIGPHETLETPWGLAMDVNKFRRLDNAFSAVKKELERQQIVWLEGLHLPQQVELGPEVEGIELVE